MKKLWRILLSLSLATAVLGGGLLWLGSQNPFVYAAPLATTWYVATTGNDGNDCLTAATPCLTVGGAEGKAANGDVIIIAAGVYEVDLTTSKTLTMTGAGRDATYLDGANAHRVLGLFGSAEITLQDVTVQNGRYTGQQGGAIYNLGTLALTNVRLTNNSSDSGGGAIYNNGALTVQNSEVISNSATNGDGSGRGGGIYANYSSTLTVTQSLIANNSADEGGGLFLLSSAAIGDSTIRDNQSTDSGGGASLFFGDVVATFDGVTFSGNQAVLNGAALNNRAGRLLLTNSTVSDNSAFNYTAVYNVGATAFTTVTNSTIAYNQASSGVVGYGGLVNVSGGTVTVQNSIVAFNDQQNCLGSITSLGNNLANDTACSFVAAGDWQSSDPLLAALGDYGGATQTHALLPGSPAIEAGDAAACPAADQRGVARPQDGDNNGTAECDIGAFELDSQLLINDVTTVTEGDAGATEAVFTVTLAPASAQVVTVDYATADDTAVSPADYNAANDTLTFTPGQTSRTITVTVNGDTADELDERFFLNLSNPANAGIIDGQGEGLIIDDDGLAALTISDGTVVEGDTGSVTAVFTVTLSPASTDTVSVTYATLAGSATESADYAAANDVLTFAPGQTSRTIAVQVYGDNIDEGSSETFSVALSSPVNANIGDGAAVGTIVDDDTARLLLEAAPEFVEGDTGTTTAVFVATLTRPTGFPVTVDYATATAVTGVPAQAGSDYAAASGSLLFAAGETSKNIPVTIYGDTVIEADETLDMNISNASSVPIAAASSTGRILNDDYYNTYLPLILR